MEIEPKNIKIDKLDTVQRIMFSLDYRQLSFKLSLMGSDQVVKSFNNLNQCFYAAEAGNNSADNISHMMALLGTFLLEIRKSMGNESTELDNFSMLEWFIKDIRNYK